MVSEIRERDTSESQVEITLKALEKLLNGPKILFHDRFQQCEYKITELYDTFYHLDENESLGIQYENISKSAQSNVDAYILSKQAKLSNENVGHNGNAIFFAINDERPLSFLESETVITQAAKDERRKKGILGVLIVLPYEADLTEISFKLNGVIPLLQQACYYDLDKARTSMEERFHKSLIQLNRIAQGEVVDKRTGFRAKSGSIFNLGAEILHQSFQPFAKLCVIFDASSVRYVFSGSSNLSSNSVESSKGSAGSNCVSTTEMSSVKDEQSENVQEGNDDVRELPEVQGYDRHPEPFSMFGRNEHKRDNSFDIPQSYVVSSNSMYGKDVGTFVDSRFSTGKGQGSMSESISTTSAYLEDAIRQVERLEARPLDHPLTDERKREIDKDDHDGPDGLLDFLPAASGRVMCSFPQSSQSVALLGIYGDDQEKYSRLDGNFLRRTMAGYFASARQSGLASQVFCEMGDGTKMTDQEMKSNFRQALGEIDEDNVVLTAACFDRLGQPAFMVVLLIQESSIVFDQFRRRMIELIGTSLTNAALHIRAEELSQAQNIFTQKVQHELRTPLHGILGVNEAVLYALRHAQDRASRSEKHEGWLEEVESLLTELVTLTHSITHSADDLSTLIDDLVDFSTPFAKTDPWLGMPTDLSQSRDKREISFQVFLSILSVVSEQRWQSHIIKRDSSTTTSPELFFWFNPIWKNSESNIEINVDAVSRVLGKLVANAIEATTEGMVRIEVSLQDVKFNKVTENTPSKSIKPDEAKPSKVKKTHILTIKVSDTGHGMSKSFLAHQIFEAYQKEDLDSPGIGLSLALCRSTVEEMGGHIVADSVEGKWTVISVSLPVTLNNKKSDIVQRNRQGSYASTDTATPDLNVAFCGCKNSISLSALRNDLLQKFGMIDVTDGLKRGIIEKVDITFIVPDGLTDEEESFPLTKDIPISLSIIMPIDQQWKKRLILKEKECFKQVGGKSRNVREVQRPLTYKNVQKLFGIIRHFCFQSAHNSVASPDDNPVVSSDKNSFETSPVEEIKSNTEQDTQNPFEEAISAASFVKTFKVLVVEDNPINTKIITALLRRAEIDFIEAVDGEQGVEMFKQELPALVLLDINMPKMNGFDAAIAMRAHPSPYKHHIAAVTALSSEVDRARGFEAGMDAWYTKPMRMSRLIEEIKRVRDAQKKLFFNFSDQQNFSPPLS